MNNQSIIEKINQLAPSLFPEMSFKKTFCIDEGSCINFYFIVDNYLGIELNIDFMDRLVNFYLIKLNSGKPYDYGYSINSEVGTIRLDFQSILKYYNPNFDKKKSTQLIYFKENEDALLERIKENIFFYAPIFQNENTMISKLHNPELWEKIKQ